MLIHQLALDTVFERLHSRPTGLSSQDAGARRLEFGSNRIEQLPRVPLLVRLAAQFTHFFAGLVWIAAALAWVVERELPGQGMGTLALAIVAVMSCSSPKARRRNSCPARAGWRSTAATSH